MPCHFLLEFDDQDDPAVGLVVAQSKGLLHIEMPESIDLAPVSSEACDS